MVLSSDAVTTASPSRVASQTRSLLSKSQPGAVQFSTRPVEYAALRADGSRILEQLNVPALPLFERAFSAFARGTLLQSVSGEIAIEDLQPGDQLWTTSGRPSTVMWIGCADFRLAGTSDSMVRVMADTFGEGRPDSFLTLGPGARLLKTPQHLRSEGTNQPLLTPVQTFVDGVNIIEVSPPTSVTLFHIVLDRHAAIRAGNLECETFHPGGQSLRSVSHSLRDLFLAMFPHIDHASDFGPLAHPRAQDTEVLNTSI